MGVFTCTVLTAARVSSSQRENIFSSQGLQPPTIRMRRGAARIKARVEFPTTPMRERRTLYDYLGVPRNASAQSIKDAYRKSVKIWHPDLAVESKLEDAASEFKKIHEAYLVLSNPEARSKYDQSLRVQNARLRLRHGFPGVSLRADDRHVALRFSNWETDQCW